MNAISRTEPIYRTTLVYAQYCGLEPYEQTLAVRHMLTDLMHLCAEYGDDFSAELAEATANYTDDKAQDDA